MSRVFLLVLPLTLAATVPQRSAPSRKPAPALSSRGRAGKVPVKLPAKPAPKPSSAKTGGKPPSVKAGLPVPAAVDPKNLQNVLAHAGASHPATESGLTSAMVEAVAAGKGRIDYNQGVARAIGLGALPPPTLTRSRAQDTLTARDAALADALRTLSMSVQQVRVSATTRVSNYLLKSDEVRLKLAGVIKSAEVVEEKLVPDAGIYRVVVQIPLVGAGSVAEAVGIAEANQAVIETVKPVNPFEPGAPAPPGVSYTGLIVDCRGLRLCATPSPKLWTERGEELFGTITVSDDFLLTQGIVAYPRSMEAAQRSSRIGIRPLVVRAHRCHDSTRCEPILSARDVQRIREANGESRFFERCAVVFVTD